MLCSALVQDIIKEEEELEAAVKFLSTTSKGPGTARLIHVISHPEP